MKCLPMAPYICVTLILAAFSSVSHATGPIPRLFGSSDQKQWEKYDVARIVPMEQLPAHVREKVKLVINNPTLYTHGREEAFLCDPRVYNYFLENPDKTMTAWKRLGAECVEIQNRGHGTFGWQDELGSDIWWQTVHPGKNVRIWYAEGKVKPGRLLPTVPVQCVVILHHNVVRQGDKEVVMQHKTDIFVRTSSRAAALVTRMMGPSVPHLAEQAAGQLQMFFGAMAWYCQKNPERAQVLLDPRPDQPTQAIDTSTRRASYNPLSLFQQQR